ncbi:MAG: hypothetical protein IJ638_04190, partial [Alphaproteobacteria bacterium]|nr:hypothetical protein [Alphaproteobacteria bacterium]
SVSGKNCGSITVDVTGYCRSTGSTSSTANAAKVGTTTINLGNCSGNTYCSNNVCTACSKPANSEWDSGSGCGWHCAEGYYADGGSCTICPKGHRCTGGVKYKCDGRDKYQDQTGQTTCKTCSSRKDVTLTLTCCGVTGNVVCREIFTQTNSDKTECLYNPENRTTCQCPSSCGK